MLISWDILPGFDGHVLIVLLEMKWRKMAMPDWGFSNGNTNAWKNLHCRKFTILEKVLETSHFIYQLVSWISVEEKKIRFGDE